MAKNLRKFSTLADYNNASLSYPSVSWVTSLDIVKYDKEEPAPSFNDNEILISFNNNVDGNATIKLWNNEYPPSAEYLSSITVSSSAGTTSISNPTETYEHTLSGESGIITLIYGTTDGAIDGQWFDYTYVGVGNNVPCDILFPIGIYFFESPLPTNTNNIVTMNPEPWGLVIDDDTQRIYVPDESVEAWKEGGGYPDNIYPLSEYDGILPINNN